MKTTDYLHINEAAANQVAEALAALLADFQVFYTNLRGFHWNIKGHAFFTLHAKFEELYNDAAEKVDEIAERILMLGNEPENRFSEYLKVARVQEVSGVSCASAALDNVLETLSHLIKEERRIIALASELNDESTLAQISGYLQEQEKTVWMLVAWAKNECCKA
jgi:starvation-inducible DNA-binding protein